LRKAFLNRDEVVVFGDNKKLGQAFDVYKKTKLLDRLQLCDMLNEVYINHAKGITVTNMLMRNYIRYKFAINLSKKTMSKYFKRLALTWKPIQHKKRNTFAYCQEILYDYITKFNDYYTQIRDDNECDYVFVFTDESYIH
jgi:hypothetical protein